MSLARSIASRKWKLQGQLARCLAPVFARSLPREIELHCPAEPHGRGSAAYVVCPEGLGPQSVVYSCGVGNDVSFDLSLIAAYGVEVFAFDPTRQSAAFLAAQALPPQFHFYPWAVAASDGELALHTMRPSASPHYLPGTVLDFDHGRRARQLVPAFRLATLLARLGHRRIDLLKLDIEGAEYRVLDDLLADGLEVRQIVLEFHPHLLNVEHHRLMLGQTGWRRTRRAIESLRAAGYRAFHVSPRGTDFSFLRT
jgi:FkbM family methyltransferase